MEDNNNMMPPEATADSSFEVRFSPASENGEMSEMLLHNSYQTDTPVFHCVDVINGQDNTVIEAPVNEFRHHFKEVPYIPDIEGRIVCENFPVFGFAFSHVGGRAENQDYFDCREIGNKGVLAVVCDGMGGGPGGRTASTRAVRIIFEYIESQLGSADSELDDQVFDNALRVANDDLCYFESTHPSYQGMGTTCVLLFLTPEKAIVRWVGDSRIYQLRNGCKLYRTDDHSRVFDLMATNAIKTLEEARTSQLSNQITSSLGFKETIPRVGRAELPYKKGDRFLLCSDGIHGAIPEEKLIEQVGQPLSKKLQKDEETGIGFIAKQLADSINFLGINKGNNRHDNLTGVLLVTKENSIWQLQLDQYLLNKYLKKDTKYTYLNYYCPTMNIFDKLFPVKVYTIGRAPENDLIEGNDMISRYHAVLKGYPFGKYTITDNSRNGTTVNGKKLANGVEVKVKRGDNIVFANIAELDWKRIDKSYGRYILAICSLIFLALFFLCISALFKGLQNKPSIDNAEMAPIEQTIPNKKAKVDDNKKSDNVKVREDSVKKNKSDTNDSEYKYDESDETTETSGNTENTTSEESNTNVGEKSTNTKETSKNFIEDYKRRRASSAKVTHDSAKKTVASSAITQAKPKVKKSTGVVKGKIDNKPAESSSSKKNNKYKKY